MKWIFPGDRPIFPAGFGSTLECGCCVEQDDPIGYDDNDDLLCEECLNG